MTISFCDSAITVYIDVEVDSKGGWSYTYMVLMVSGEYHICQLHSLLMSVNKTYNLVEYKPHERRTITWENVVCLIRTQFSLLLD